MISLFSRLKANDLVLLQERMDCHCGAAQALCFEAARPLPDGLAGDSGDR